MEVNLVCGPAILGTVQLSSLQAFLAAIGDIDLPHTVHSISLDSPKVLSVDCVCILSDKITALIISREPTALANCRYSRDLVALLDTFSFCCELNHPVTLIM